jgi:xanthine dehydrogenase small subunit
MTASASTRDHVILWVNGRRLEVRGADMVLTLSAFLRTRLHLTGTKIACNEGDCGACTVAVRGRVAGSWNAIPVDSCIRFVFQCDGQAFETVEGLAAGGVLTPVQQAMVECHGSQCGYCTPGFVMTLSAVHEQARQAGTPADAIDWPVELAGNLCRCTGYAPILEAGAVALRCQDAARPLPLANRDTIAAESAKLRRDMLDLEVEQPAHCRIYRPATMEQALDFRAAHPDAVVIAGGTDIAVDIHHGTPMPAAWLDLSGLDALTELSWVDPTGDAGTRVLRLGALATWEDVRRACREACPEFAALLTRFGGPQIRHVGTVGGNIVTGSSIADALPFLVVMGAVCEVASARGPRTVGIEAFIADGGLASDELLIALRLPLPAPHERLQLAKVSRRHDLDIATVGGAFRMMVDGGVITAATVAVGGVAPTVVRLPQTEAWLTGRPFTPATFAEAGDRAVGEITPRSDVRGSADYRSHLVRGLLRRFAVVHTSHAPDGAPRS